MIGVFVFTLFFILLLSLYLSAIRVNDMSQRWGAAESELNLTLSIFWSPEGARSITRYDMT